MSAIFLGWDRPVLHCTVDFLVARHTVAGRLDLRGVTLVTPSLRSAMRLEEILAEQAATMDDPAWYPPEIIGPETLAERFYEVNPSVASPLVRLIGWIDSVKTLDATDPGLLRPLLPHRPNDLSDWMNLGRTLRRLFDDLTSGGVTFLDVAQHLESEGLSTESPRWRTLAALERLYTNDAPNEPGWLERHSLTDPMLMRLAAAEHLRPEMREKIVSTFEAENRRFYLVGPAVTDTLTKRILANFMSYITPLIFAPETERGRFDPFGDSLPQTGRDATEQIEEERIRIVGRPEEEANAVIDLLASFGAQYAAGEIVVAVPDAEVIPFLEDRFARANLATRRTFGTPLSQTALYRALDTLRRFLKTKRFGEYAELVRHPLIERFIRKTVWKDYLTQLDQYHNNFFQVEMGETWQQSDSDRYDLLPEIWRLIFSLLNLSPAEAFGDERPTTWWLEKLFSTLEALCEKKDSAEAVMAEQIVRRKLNEWKQIPTEERDRLKYVDFLALFCFTLESEMLPPEETTDAIEVTGWPELAFSDSPVVLVTGMNDAIIPGLSVSDIFLPDTLRTALGLKDNAYRKARDAYALRLIHRTRRESGKAYFIACRRDNEGGAKLPSRFLFTAENDTQSAKRIYKYFNTALEGNRTEYDVTPESSQAINSLIPVRLPQTAPSDHSFYVTDFYVYRQCPRLYYLRCLRRFKKLDDAQLEIKANDFGTLMHSILEQFGNSDSAIRDSDSEVTIQEFLDHTLDEVVHIRFGERPDALLYAQIQQMRRRLQRFAVRQAEWRKKGYKIVSVEFAPKADNPVTIAGVPLYGRIDRIDRNEQSKETVIIDYKTGKEPDAGFDHATGEWIDFQMPLYTYLLQRSGFVRPDEPLLCGYFWLPNELEKIGLIFPDWTGEEMRLGAEQAEQIAQTIQATDWSTVLPSENFPCANCYKEYSVLCR